MKLDKNTKRVLLFAALLLAAYLISLVFGGKDEPVSQGTSAAYNELETAVRESQEDLETAPGSPEDPDTVAPGSPEGPETAVPGSQEDPETELPGSEAGRESETEADAGPESEIADAEKDAESDAAETEKEAESEAAEPVKESESETVKETETKTAKETETESETKTSAAETQTEPEAPAGISVDEDGEYTDKEHVALYIHTFGHLPSNFITKKEANELGWPEEGNLGKVAPGMSIGGDYFGNYEGLLPKKKGRKYYECDIDFKGKSRGAKRIIYSNDGLIFYTDDHYESFEQLYGGN